MDFAESIDQASISNCACFFEAIRRQSVSTYPAMVLPKDLPIPIYPGHGGITLMSDHHKIITSFFGYIEPDGIYLASEYNFLSRCLKYIGTKRRINHPWNLLFFTIDRNAQLLPSV